MGNEITSALRPALVLTILFALLLGLAYPLALTGIGQVVFPAQANGSLLRDGNKLVGSALIGQTFASDRYFQGRPSAAGKGYDGLASSGSNLGPSAQALVDRIKPDIAIVTDVIAVQTDIATSVAEQLRGRLPGAQSVLVATPSTTARASAPPATGPWCRALAGTTPRRARWSRARSRAR